MAESERRVRVVVVGVEIVGDELAGAGVVPGNLRNVGEGGEEIRAVGGAEVRGRVVEIGGGEVGATDGDVVGSGGIATHADSVGSSGLVGVRAGGAFVAGGDKEGDALEGGTEIEVGDVGVFSNSELRLGLTVADADDVGNGASLQEIGEGEEAAELGGVAAGRVDDSGVGSGSGGPLDIDGCLAVVAVGAGIATAIRASGI